MYFREFFDSEGFKFQIYEKKNDNLHREIFFLR